MDWQQITEAIVRVGFPPVLILLTAYYGVCCGRWLGFNVLRPVTQEYILARRAERAAIDKLLRLARRATIAIEGGAIYTRQRRRKTDPPRPVEGMQ